MDEKLASKIRDVLTKACPAFRNEGSQTAIWHGCFCLAQGENKHCDCVWHEKSTCLVGQWPQLAFVDKAHAKTQTIAEQYLTKAKQAIAKAEKS